MRRVVSGPFDALDACSRQGGRFSITCQSVQPAVGFENAATRWHAVRPVVSMIASGRPGRHGEILRTGILADLRTPVLRWKDRQMPYLQLDTPFSYSTETKQRLAKRLGEIYAEKMNSNINRISVAIRQLGEGGVRRCGGGDPRPAALLMCDIRRGRPPRNNEQSWPEC